jgi:hypothetical protein
MVVSVKSQRRPTKASWPYAAFGLFGTIDSRLAQVTLGPIIDDHFRARGEFHLLKSGV